MSYPPLLYHGEAGGASATITRADAEPDIVYPNGNLVTYLATGESASGLYGLYRWQFSDAVSGPGPHFHRTISESFYIISGSVRVYDGTQWVTTRPGDFLHVPPDGLHGFRNESGEPAEMLLHFAPGAPREPYFEGLLGLANGEEWSQAEYDAFMAAHDNVWVD